MHVREGEVVTRYCDQDCGIQTPQTAEHVQNSGSGENVAVVWRCNNCRKIVGSVRPGEEPRDPKS